MSIFANVPLAPADPILGLATRFKADTFSKKVNLGIGAYRTPEGKPWILPSVKEAEKMAFADTGEDKEYQPIDGKPEYKKPVQQLLFPDEIVDSGCLATSQSLSGTGSLQIIGQFLVFCGCKKIYGPDPTWGNHPKIMTRAGLAYGTYPYWHQESRGLDFVGMIEAIKKMDEGEAILLHAVAHNPTGVDPTKEQWRDIIKTVKERKLIPLLDNAYQGYASGNLAEDNYATQVFIEEGMEFFLAQSFAKNFGLYGERIGYIHVKCASKDDADRVLSQMKTIIRQAYSSPPRHGACIVNKILTTPKLKEQWLGELKLMSDRIVSMRSALRNAVEAKGTPGTWNHITDQIGMFTFTGLTKDQVTRMVDECHIYMTGDGRISMAGLNPGNVDYVAECIDAVVRGIEIPEIPINGSRTALVEARPSPPQPLPQGRTYPATVIAGPPLLSGTPLPASSSPGVPFRMLETRQSPPPTFAKVLQPPRKSNGAAPQVATVLQPRGNSNGFATQPAKTMQMYSPPSPMLATQLRGSSGYLGAGVPRSVRCN